MNVREHLRQAVIGVPEGGAITLPVEAVRRWLQEDARSRDDLASGQQVFSTSEAAELAGVQPDTVSTWAKEGRLPNAWKTGPEGGGQWRIPESDLLALRNGGKNETDRVRFD